MRRILVAPVVALLRFYQLAISPLLPSACRFYPTCSQFAIDAFKERGLVWGAILTAGRLLRCHPFHPGGCDPVPVSARVRGRV